MPRSAHRPRLEQLEDRLLLKAPSAAPSLGPPPPPSASVVWVDTVAELQTAVRNLRSNQTVVIERGTYNLTETLIVGRSSQVSNVTLRGATDNFNDVVLRGRGMENASYGSVPHGISVWNAQDVTLANLSVGEVYFHPIDLQGQFGAERVRLYHNRVFNGGQQLIKSNAGGGGVDDCVLEYNLVEYTNGTPVTDHTNGGGFTGYTGGLHAHGCDNWVIRHNVWRNFHTPDTVTFRYNPVVLMWRGSSNTIVESNTFTNCDRAVAFGLDTLTTPDHRGGVIRNNYIWIAPGLFSASRRAGADTQIAVYNSPDTKVYHNTILTNGNTPRSIEVRWANTGVDIRNNLADTALGARDGGAFTQGGNYLQATAAMFVNAAAGDFRLVLNSATQANVIDRAPSLAAVTNDWEGDARPQGNGADVGADEYRAASPPPPNSPPTAADDAFSTNEDQAVTVNVLSNDRDANGDALSVVSVTQGANGTVAVGANGVLSYTPRADFNGADSFTYTIGDGKGGTATATVRLTIAPVNDTPVARDDAATTSQGVPVVLAVLANDSDVDGNALTVAGVTQPARGTVTVNGNGTLTYTPAAGFVGADSFTYTISDGNGRTATATVRLTVLATPGVSVALGPDPWNTSRQALVVRGTAGNDRVEVMLASNSQALVVAVNGAAVGQFPLSAVSRILVYGMDGDDTLTVGGSVRVAAQLDGGRGNDALNGGGGDDVLLGSDGGDLLGGGTGRDLLIGGVGGDILLGSLGQDILIAGVTTHDGNDLALRAIVQEWTSARSYDERVQRLATGAGGLPRLDASTVPRDSAVNYVLGGTDLDWFFGDPLRDRFDRFSGERLN